MTKKRKHRLYTYGAWTSKVKTQSVAMILHRSIIITKVQAKLQTDLIYNPSLLQHSNFQEKVTFSSSHSFIKLISFSSVEPFGM